MSTETTNKKIKIDNGTTFGKTYTDKAIDAKLPTDLIASANKLSLGVGNNALGNGVNLDGFTYDEATKTLKASGGSQLDYLYFNLVEDDEGNNMFTYTLEQYNEMIAKKPIIFNDKGFYYNAVADKNNDTNNYEITLTKIENIGPEISYANATLVLHGVLSSTSLKTTLSLVKGEIINYQVSTNSSTNNSYLDITYVNALTGEQAIGTLMPDYTLGNNNQVMTIVNGYPEWADINMRTISLFGKHSILVPNDSADTSILPCTTADNGKVLSVVNGEAQWASASGGELTGEALMNATKDSTTITRTLDTDGKVKFDAKGGNDNTLTIFDYPTDGKLTDEQFNMLKANPGKYVIRKKTWDKKDELFLSSGESDPSYNIVYADNIISVQGQNSVLYEHHIMLDENNKKLLSKNNAKAIVADYQKLPQVPSDASSSTYILKLVNGKANWVKESA